MWCTPGSAGIYLPAADNKTDIYPPRAGGPRMNEPRRRPTIVHAGKMPAFPGTPCAKLWLNC